MTIRFYLDFISPFGYLARGRLLDIAARYGAQVEYRPVDIFPLRERVGSTGPSNSAIPAKLAYFTKDRERWAAFYGMSIVERPAGFDTGAYNRGTLLAAMRGQADAYVEQAYACIWRDGLDPEAEEGRHELERRMGWERGELSAFAAAPETAERYAQLFEMAIADGVFGVPSFVVDGELWWGNDRLDFLERFLAGKSWNTVRNDRQRGG